MSLSPPRRHRCLTYYRNYLLCYHPIIVLTSVTSQEIKKQQPAIDLAKYRVGYLQAVDRPNHYVYFMERRDVKRGPFHGEEKGIRLIYQD